MKGDNNINVDAKHTQKDDKIMKNDNSNNKDEIEISRDCKFNNKDKVNVVKDNMKVMEGDNNVKVDVNNVVEEEDTMGNIIRLLHIAVSVPHQVHSIVRCPRISRFVQESSPNHKSLKLELETVHDVNMNFNGNNNIASREPVTKENKRMIVDNTNYPDTGASITIPGRSLMKKMWLNNSNFLKDNARFAAAEGTTIEVIGFISVKLTVKYEGG